VVVDGVAGDTQKLGDFDRRPALGQQLRNC
jgi:hypothetical protein